MAQILTSIRGKQLGLSAAGRLICPSGFVAGDHGSQIEFSSPTRVAQFDDFVGASQAFSTTIINGWRSRKGSDGACVDWTVTPAKNGTIVGTIGNTTASMAVSGVQLDSALDWEPDASGLSFEARVQLSRITNIAAYIGLTDQTAALEMPIQSAGGAHTITTNCTDGCGFLFDTSDSSTAQWLLTGVANDVDATVQSGIGVASAAVVPVAATYATFRIEVDASGNAAFYYNGLQVGVKMAGACTKTVPLTPVVAAFNRTTSGAPTVTVDYIAMAASRV